MYTILISIFFSIVSIFFLVGLSFFRAQANIVRWYAR